MTPVSGPGAHTLNEPTVVQLHHLVRAHARKAVDGLVPARGPCGKEKAQRSRGAHTKLFRYVSGSGHASRS